jgi:hypothetical protein
MIFKLVLIGVMTFWVIEFVAWFAPKYVMHRGGLIFPITFIKMEMGK